ncbi:hypothetical protein PsorP6_000075 [Peronosclerospora sorghi]|uniref:Uncharacterized protein n=1 Tax=Peronosclerospora sorghi TaxID=230839 RepID=A0ACC0WSK5_9STRA|nr:hypothetical protein PsorP6_000075 [Peronosclerospora sorghi]
MFIENTQMISWRQYIEGHSEYHLKQSFAQDIPPSRLEPSSQGPWYLHRSTQNPVRSVLAAASHRRTCSVCQMGMNEFCYRPEGIWCHLDRGVKTTTAVRVLFAVLETLAKHMVGLELRWDCTGKFRINHTLVATWTLHTAPEILTTHGQATARFARSTKKLSRLFVLSFEKTGQNGSNI